MTAQKLEKFGGMLPAWAPHLVPDGQATKASNAYLFTGSLAGWRVPTLLRQLTNSAAKYAFRLPVVVQAVATAYLVFQTQPAAGDTVSLGEMTYTWRTTMSTANAAFDVLIGASTNASAVNLLNALTFDRGNGTNQGISRPLAKVTSRA